MLKSHRGTAWIKKKYKTHLYAACKRFTSNLKKKCILEVKERKKIFYKNVNKNKARIAILYHKKIDFK